MTAELGLELDYTQLDAAWGWRGPELAFRDVRVRAAGDAAPFLTARGASVGFKTIDLLFRLATGRKLGADRLTFDGTELTLVHNEDGLPIAGRAADDARAGFGAAAARHRSAGTQQPRAVSRRRAQHRLGLPERRRQPAPRRRRVDARSERAPAAGVRRAHRADGAGVRRRRRRWPAASSRAIGACRPTSTPWISRSPRGCSRRRRWRRKPAAATWPCGSSGRRACSWAARRTSRSPTWRCRARSAQSIRASSSVALSGDWQRTSDSWRFALRDVAVTRAGRAWPEAATVDIDVRRDADGIQHFALRSSFLRLDDLTPFFAPLPESRLLESWFALAPRGDLRAVDIALTRNADARVDYTVAADFTGLGIERFQGLPGVTGLTGQLRTDSRTGRLELASEGAVLDWPDLFRGVLDGRRAARHRRVARRPRRSAGRQRRSRSSSRRPRRCARTSSSRCRWTAARRSSICAPASRGSTSRWCRNTCLRTRCRRPSSRGSTRRCAAVARRAPS